MTPAATRSDPPSKWGVALLLGVVALTVRALTNTPDTTAPQPPVQPAAPIETVSNAPAPSAPAEVARADVDRAGRHASLAVGAEGATGAMIYSVNCHASLKRAFSTSTLDRCGAFDLLAARQAFDPLEQAAAAAWFDAAAARSRFIAGAASGGLTEADAAARLLRVAEFANGVTAEPVSPPPAAAVEEPAEQEETAIASPEAEASSEVQENVAEDEVEPDGE